MTFGSSYREVRKIEGSRNRDSTVLILRMQWYVSNTPVILTDDFLNSS